MKEDGPEGQPVGWPTGRLDEPVVGGLLSHSSAAYIEGKIMKILLILLLFCTAVGAQTKDELRKKYGEPFSETFVVRSGVTVTATYEPNEQVKELLIAPQPSSELIKSKPAALSYDTLKGIIDELIPG